MVRKDEGWITSKGQLKEEGKEDVRQVAKKKLAEHEKKEKRHHAAAAKEGGATAAEMEPLRGTTNEENANNNASQPAFHIPFADDPDSGHQEDWIRTPDSEGPLTPAEDRLGSGNFSKSQGAGEPAFPKFVAKLQAAKKGKFDERISINISGLRYKGSSILELHMQCRSEANPVTYLDSPGGKR